MCGDQRHGGSIPVVAASSGYEDLCSLRNQALISASQPARNPSPRPREPHRPRGATVPLRTSQSTMSLEPPTYLSSLQNNIRARPIPWEGAVRAGNITDEHLRKIKAVDKVRKEQRRQTVEADLKGYTTLLAGGPDGRSVFESAAKRTDIIQYMLVLAADLINGTRGPGCQR